MIRVDAESQRRLLSELAHLREQVTSLQERGTEMLLESRELKAERDWLAQRLIRAAFPRRAELRDWGKSADALVAYALGGPEPNPYWNYPWNAHDLEACERTYLGAPEHLKPRMLPMLESYREAVESRCPGAAAKALAKIEWRRRAQKNS